jgi:hypothetical protein
MRRVISAVFAGVIALVLTGGLAAPALADNGTAVVIPAAGCCKG